MNKIPTYYKSPHKIAGVNKSEPVLLALSGGADSVSLLYNLIEDSKIAGFSVFAAHVNHNIRLDAYNNEAKRDEEFCRKLCDSLGIKLFVADIDVPALSLQSGESIESAARRARYDFFAKVMRENGISLLVTAHNATDNLETQIFNLCRGSGISGIAGIPVCRVFDTDKTVVRPILSGTKAEILEFCDSNSLAFVTDSTNFEAEATRNKIRNNILPELKKIFPSAEDAASRLAAFAANTSDYLKLEAEKYLLDSATVCKGEVSFSVQGLNSLHIALRGAVIQRVGDSFGISLQHTHIDSALALAERAIPHSQIDMPGDLICTIEDGSVIFSHHGDNEKSLPYEIGFDGKFVKIPSEEFLVVAGEENLSGIDTQVYNLYTSATLRSDKIKDGLLLGGAFIRSRREGDKIIDGGNTKKLKKLMCDKKVPLKVRNSLPILCLDGEIVYVPMCAICDNAKHDGEGEIQIFIYKKL